MTVHSLIGAVPTVVTALMLEAAAGQPMVVLPSIAKAMDDAIAKGHGKDDLGAIAAEVIR